MGIDLKKLISKITKSSLPTHVDGVSPRISTSKEAIKSAFLDNLFYIQGKFPGHATMQDYYLALAYLVRDRMLQRWISTTAGYTANRSRTLAYLSAEFLLGPHLENNIINLGIEKQTREAVEELGFDYEELLNQEEEPGLGNGGLGRLAACYLDSMATLGIPSLGYGIRYEFGIFDQEISDGWQVEKTDKWLRYGNPWEIARPEWSVTVRFGGHTERVVDKDGRERVRWTSEKMVRGIPYDTPILGYHTNTANTLRLWSAEAPESFDFSAFNSGDYYGAVNQKVESENLTKVLYPNDEQVQGKELRLAQQFFFVSCSLQDMLRIMRTQKIPLTNFYRKFVIQLNDTHPAIAVVELMRLLVDEHGLEWDKAWKITTKSFAYTNHTLLPEALEKWPVDMMARVLPRHLEIIFDINKRFLKQAREQQLDDQVIARLSLIDESGERYVRMANLACVGSFAVNGVAALHSRLLTEDVLKDFHSLWPGKFSNKTNGVTPRRWLVLSNPQLSDLISEQIGESWKKEFSELKRLQSAAEEQEFRRQWRQVKHDNKIHFASVIKKMTGAVIDPDSMFDVQVKRIHEYKRQHLNVLHIISLYQRLKDNPNQTVVPRTFIFGGKAAPGYFMAKLIIKLINSVAEVIERDKAVRDRLRVVYLPNFNVKNGHWVYPAAELSEQISTAGKEASGTGNMKFAINGALTIGTLDGANIEIREEVGAENFFLFGHTAQEIRALQDNGYHAADYYENSETLKAVIEAIRKGHFSNGDRNLFQPIVDNLLYHDPYFLLADFQSYVDKQQEVDSVYLDQDSWTRMSILNTARSGKFSSDRAILEYCREIWKIKPVSTKLLTAEDLVFK